MADNSHRLAGHIPEPTIKNRVLAAARANEFPFLLSEIVDATGLNRQVVNRVLCRLVKQGVLTRHKIPMSRPTFDRAKWVVKPNGRQYPIFLYAFAPGAA